MNNNGPVLGFTGKISSRLDFGLLSKLASNHFDWNFAMIGPCTNYNLKKDPAYNAFTTSPNVHMLGPKPYQKLPEQMQSFDVCILPYRVNDPFNVHCSPLKLYEYLATGKPIVSTNIPAVADFKGLVRIAEHSEDFDRQVIKALEEHNGYLCKLRMAKAQENSWESRAGDIIKILNKYFEIKRK